MSPRVLLSLLSCAAVLMAAGAWLALAEGAREPAPAPRVAASPSPVSSPPPAAPAEASGEDAEAVEAWFRAAVLEELERDGRDAGWGAGAPGPADVRLVGTPADDETPIEVAAAGPTPEERRAARAAQGSAVLREMEAEGRLAAVDWDYVDDVFQGRISGIPSEHRAGLTLPELDRLGEIPYVEQLREEGRADELRELGLGNGSDARTPSVPWPECVRLGVCRRDALSSP